VIPCTDGSGAPLRYTRGVATQQEEGRVSGRRSGLGRGLESLIPGIGAESERGSTTQVDIDALEPNPHQPRNEDQLASLAASIREHGIIQPILVSRRGGKKPFQIIAGERRWRAAQRAGLSSVPILVREATPSQILELALVENIQRADLNAIEEALAYRQLAVEFGMKQAEIADRVGKSRPAIANALRLLSAPEDVREAVANDEISAGHAKALLQIEDPVVQAEVLAQVLRNGLSVRDTERLAQRATQARPRRERTEQPDPTMRAIETDLQRALGTKVELARGKAGGRITISFHSDEELTAILERIVGSDELDDY
jgi:ParB family transcriptional regulator, chromosome partitioning protein